MSIVEDLMYFSPLLQTNSPHHHDDDDDDCKKTRVVKVMYSSPLKAREQLYPNGSHATIHSNNGDVDDDTDKDHREEEKHHQAFSRIQYPASTTSRIKCPPWAHALQRLHIKPSDLSISFRQYLPSSSPSSSSSYNNN
eukprot:686268-Ditylum_brightwellii.AAC.1